MKKIFLTVMTLWVSSGAFAADQQMYKDFVCKSIENTAKQQKESSVPMSSFQQFTKDQSVKGNAQILCSSSRENCTDQLSTAYNNYTTDVQKLNIAINDSNAHIERAKYLYQNYCTGNAIGSNQKSRTTDTKN